MTTLTLTAATPAPRWQTLREHAPEVLDDLVDLWARLDELPAGGRQATELRWLVEHLGLSIEDLFDRWPHPDFDDFDLDDFASDCDDDTEVSDIALDPADALEILR